MQRRKPPKVDAFNRGLETFIAWGPAMAIPIEKRLAEFVPDGDPGKMKSLIAEYQAISSKASSIVYGQVENRESEESGRAAVAAIDPRVSAENASMMYTQARVSAGRDGIG